MDDESSRDESMNVVVAKRERTLEPLVAPFDFSEVREHCDRQASRPDSLRAVI